MDLVDLEEALEDAAEVALLDAFAGVGDGEVYVVAAAAVVTVTSPPAGVYLKALLRRLKRRVPIFGSTAA